MEETNVSPVADTQIPAPELAESPEVATPETVETQPEQTREEDPHAKSLKSMERRIQRLTAARYQAAADAEQARKEAEQLRQRYSQYEQQPEQQELTPEKVLPIAQQIAQQMREVEKVKDTISTVLTKGKALEGFDAACNLVDVEVPFYERNGKPSDFLRAVLACDAPEKVLHHLGKNPDVAAELAGKDPIQVARKLARIEIEMQAPKEPKQSTAPKPIAPVKGKREDSGLSDELPTEEWVKRFHKLRRG